MHVNEDAVFPEIVDDSGRELAPGECGDLVLTGFFGDAFPFIRYRIGDTAEWVEGRCDCGTSFRRLRLVSGRADTAMTLSDGRRRSAAQLCEELRAVESLLQYQIRQVEPDRVQLDVVAVPGAAEKTVVAAEAALRRRLGEPCAIDVAAVAAIPRTPGGKVRDLIPLEIS